MAEYDLKSYLSPVPTIPFVSYGGGGAVNGASVNLSGFESAIVVTAAGQLGGGTVDFIVEEADDDGTGSPDTFTTVTDANLHGVVADLQLLNGTDEDLVHSVGYMGKKEWIRVRNVEGAAWTTMIHGAIIIRGNPRVVPTT
jgi:hypothetical protein